ncbi:hypothetical protein [Streptomyces tauricus]
MRLHRVAPGIAAGILAPALLLATPSFAATAAPTAVTVPAVSSSANEPDADDLRVAIVRIFADPSISPALRAAANAALDDNTPEALRHFLEVGRYQVA